MADNGWENAFLQIHGKTPESNRSSEPPLKRHSIPLLRKLRMTPTKQHVKTLPKTPTKSPCKPLDYGQDLLSESPLKLGRKLTDSCRKKLDTLTTEANNRHSHFQSVCNIGSILNKNNPPNENEETDEVEQDQNDDNVENDETPFAISPGKRRSKPRKDAGNFVKINMRCKKVIRKAKKGNVKRKFRRH